MQKTMPVNHMVLPWVELVHLPGPTVSDQVRIFNFAYQLFHCYQHNLSSSPWLCRICFYFLSAINFEMWSWTYAIRKKMKLILLGSGVVIFADAECFQILDFLFLDFLLVFSSRVLHCRRPCCQSSAALYQHCVRCLREIFVLIECGALSTLCAMPAGNIRNFRWTWKASNHQISDRHAMPRSWWWIHPFTLGVHSTSDDVHCHAEKAEGVATKTRYRSVSKKSTYGA